MKDVLVAKILFFSWEQLNIFKEPHLIKILYISHIFSF